MSNNKPSWRDHWRVHPACECFPIMPPRELHTLADDIGKHGLKVPIQTRNVAGEDQPYLIDDRNRLDAMELLGWRIIDEHGEWHGALALIPGTVPAVIHRNEAQFQHDMRSVIHAEIQRFMRQVGARA
jgi:ParB-like chromosome segregation protein Spo0J